MSTSYVSAAVDPWDLLICEIQCPITSNVSVDLPTVSSSLPSTSALHVNDSVGVLRVVSGTVENRLTEHVLSYLARAEVREVDPWARDDYRVAWLTVLRASEGHSDPWRFSFWSYYGTVPERAIPYWQERTESREQLLGPGLDFAASAKRSGKASRAAGGAEEGASAASSLTTGSGSLGASAPLTLAATPVAAYSEADSLSPLTAASEQSLPPKKPVQSVVLAEKVDAQ